MAMHSKARFFQAGCVRRFGIGGTTAAAGVLALTLALALALSAPACNCDNATGPSANQSTGGNLGGGGSSNTIVKGRVVGAGGSPVVGASVATSSAFPTFTQKTDDDGEYWSDLPDAGTVTVKVTASGFADQSRSVTVVSGHSVRADFTLQRQ
jgi:Carboxypeptidase regulatory-like domain